MKNIYIESLKNQNKLQISTDLTRSFKFQIGSKLVGNDFLIISGPCSVESEDMIKSFSVELKKAGIDALRGGAYKPCTFPIREPIHGWQEGLKQKGIEFLAKAKKLSGLPIVSEIMDARHLDMCLDYIDVVQVGTRNFQNYTLLDELGKINGKSTKTS